MKKLVILFLAIIVAGGVSAQQNEKKTAILNHVALYVVDLNKSTNFYKNIIHLDTIPEPFHDGKHTWFKVGEHSHLHIIQGAASVSPHDKNTHICFSVPSVEEFIILLKKNNIPFENWPGEKNTYTLRVDGVKQVYLQDPDGFWVEVNDDKY